MIFSMQRNSTRHKVYNDISIILPNVVSSYEASSLQGCWSISFDERLEAVQDAISPSPDLSEIIEEIGTDTLLLIIHNALTVANGTNREINNSYQHIRNVYSLCAFGMWGDNTLSPPERFVNWAHVLSIIDGIPL